MGLQKVEYNLAAEQQQQILNVLSPYWESAMCKHYAQNFMFTVI